MDIQQPVWGWLYPMDPTNPRYELTGPEYTAIEDVTFKFYLCSSNTENHHNNSLFKITKSEDVYLFVTHGTCVLVNGLKAFPRAKVILEHGAKIVIHSSLNTYEYIFVNADIMNKLQFSKDIGSKYVLSHQLGRGSFGEVLLAFEKGTCKKYAVKVIRKENKECNVGLMEATLLRSLDHPCIIRLVEHLEAVTASYLVLQYMSGGTLASRVFPKKTIQEENVKLMIYQLVMAVDYLHTMNIIHRDIKLENILLASETPDTLIKVADFGISIRRSYSESVTPMGSAHYIAPEILNCNINNVQYTSSTDVWSIGVVLFVSLSGLYPFQNHETIIQCKYSLQNEAWKGISSTAIDMVKKILVVDPENRITIKELLKHSWFKDKHMRKKTKILMKQEAEEWRSYQNDNNNEVKENFTTFQRCYSRSLPNLKHVTICDSDSSRQQFTRLRHQNQENSPNICDSDNKRRQPTRLKHQNEENSYDICDSDYSRLQSTRPKHPEQENSHDVCDSYDSRLQFTRLKYQEQENSHTISKCNIYSKSREKLDIVKNSDNTLFYSHKPKSVLQTLNGFNEKLNSRHKSNSKDRTYNVPLHSTKRKLSTASNNELKRTVNILGYSIVKR